MLDEGVNAHTAKKTFTNRTVEEIEEHRLLLKRENPIIDLEYSPMPEDGWRVSDLRKVARCMNRDGKWGK